MERFVLDLEEYIPTDETRYWFWPRTIEEILFAERIEHAQSGEANHFVASFESEQVLVVLDVAGNLRSISYPAYGKLEFTISEPDREASVPPEWAASMTSPPTKRVDWDQVLNARPDLIPDTPIVEVTASTDVYPRTALDSQCRHPPFTRRSLAVIDTLESGLAFVCQINLEDIPRDAGLGLPSTGLLQFFTHDFDEDQQPPSSVRFIPKPDLADHDPGLAELVLQNRHHEVFFEPAMLSFRTVYEIPDPSPFDPFVARAERYRFARSTPDIPPYAGLREALARRGIAAVGDLQRRAMGGCDEGKASTPDGYVRLLSFSDDVLVYSWNIPVEDLAGAVFSRAYHHWAH